MAGRQQMDALGHRRHAGRFHCGHHRGQETDSGDTINARYGRVRALIYHPGGLADAPAAWPIRNAFQVDEPAFNGFTPRFLVMDPTPSALLYWDSTTTVTRYDTR